jgi:hypothetical protein
MAAAPPLAALYGSGPGVLCCVRVLSRDRMLWAKAFTGDLFGGVDGGALGCHFPHWGHHVGAPFQLHGFSR